MKAYQENPTNNKSSIHTIIKDCLITLSLCSIATIIAFWFFYNVSGNPDNLPNNPTNANISLVYITALVLVARFTNGYVYGIIASLVGVVCVNFLFTYPYFSINFTLSGYPVTFLFMLIISVTISAMTTQIKLQGKILLEREKLLMEAEKEKMRANLLRSVSHDLRTPLTGIIGNTSTYIDNTHTLREDEKLQIVSHINEDSNWLLNMVENLLSVTRIDERSMKIAMFPEWVTRYGDKIGNFGGIDTDAVCRLGRQEMREYISDVVKQCRGHGGFAFGSGNSIPQYVPAEGYLTMVETIRELRGED